MKRNLLTLLVTLAATVCPPLARCDTAVEAWTRRYSNLTASQDRAYRVATDSAGNVIVVGYTDEGVNGDDMLIIKYSGAGVPLWTNRYSGEPYAMAIDGGNNVLVTGRSGESGGNFDYATIKYSSAGVALWTNRYDGPGNGRDEAWAVAVDGGGNVLVTGASDGIGTGTDYVTIKYSGAGAPLWTNRYNGLGNGSDAAAAVAVDGSANVFVTGYSPGSNGDEDYTTIAYSSAGATLWINRYNGPANSYDYANALAVDGSGNVFVTGSSDSGAADDDYVTIAYSGAGVALWTNRYNGPGSDEDVALAMAVAGTNIFVTGLSYSGTSYDYATINYSSAGVALWTNRYNGPANGVDEAFAIAVDGNGNVFVTGHSFGSGTYSDYATVALSSAGMVLWITRYNGPKGDGNDQASAVATDAGGNVFVTGRSYSGASDDWATIKYSSVGLALWTNRYNGPGNNDDDAYAVAVDGSGRIYVTGYSQGNNSREDWATVAYSSVGGALWTNRFNGLANESDRASAVAAGGGNVYVTGYSLSGESLDYTTIAYSSAGAALWTNFYGGRGVGAIIPKPWPWAGAAMYS